MADTTESGGNPESDGHVRRVALIGGGVVLVAVVLAVAAVWLSGRGDDDVATGDDTTSTTESSAPGPTDADPSGSPDVGGLDGSHPFVGRTELDTREVYPNVRVTWRDGQPLPSTMDFVAGRVNLAVRDGEIVAASVECDEGVDSPEMSWATQACDPSPDDGPTVWGKLIAGPGGEGLVLEPGFQADRYYAGMSVSPRQDPVPVSTTSGEAIDFDELAVGDVVWLWVAPACRESSPVQCDLHAVTVDR